MENKPPKFYKGETVTSNVGRGKGLRCKVVSVHTTTRTAPDGTEVDVHTYVVQTPQGTRVTRTHDRLGVAAK